MNAENFNVDMLRNMRHSPVRNYVVPGLTSWLIGSPGPAGTMRLFECERAHQESITPHSHRFDFQCWVLRGRVTNRTWKASYWTNQDADLFQATMLRYSGAMGSYERVVGERNRWIANDKVFSEGECYSMMADEVHSIYFDRNTVVLFFEGPTITAESIIIEPVVNGITVPTFKVEPWMFARVGSE